MGIFPTEHKDPIKLLQQARQNLKKNLDQALDSYTQAINTHDLSIKMEAEAYEERARLWFTLGKPHQAIADLRHSIELAPKRVSAWLTRAKIWLHQGKRKQALR